MSILGYTTKRWPLWKSATKWDSEILNLGTSFDTQPHISFCNRKQRVMRTCEASAATVYVSFLTKFLQEATRLLDTAYTNIYQYSFLLNVPHCIWRKNYCGTLGSMNHLESSRIIKCKVWNLVSFHASNIFQPVSFVFCPALFIFPVSFMFGPRLIVRQQEVWIGNYFHPFSNSFCGDFLPSEQLIKHWVCQA